MYAVIRIRGRVSVSPDVKKSLELLHLKRTNNLSLWQESDQSLRMIKVAETSATFGKIDDATLKEVLEKKAISLTPGEKVDVKKVLEELKAGKTIKQAGVENCFRLSPPKTGYGRGGIKKAFKVGGGLGDRKSKINELIKKML